ncbi:MAG: hypothetical protein ACR2NK_19000 [Mariniblastus sp.]
MRRWYMQFFRGRPFSGSNRRWWAGVAEASLAGILMLAGVVSLCVVLTVTVLNWESDAANNISTLVIFQLLLSVALIIIGGLWISRLLWHVGVSAERRGAIATRKNEIELLNELRRQRQDLPTVARDQFPPKVGKNLPVRLIPSPRNIWGLVTTGIFSVILVAIGTVLSIIVADSFGVMTNDWFQKLQWNMTDNPLEDLSNRPWLAAGWLFPITLAAMWSIYQFFRQLLKLTGIGSTSLEISNYPLTPGNSYQIFLSQAGRVRLKLLDVDLICQEEATFNQGTDIRTEITNVFSQRLFRRRGIGLKPSKPFETEFDLTIPSGSMHSFKSLNNRILWKIVVTGQAKNWPSLERNFTLSIHPPAQLETKPKIH